MNVNILLCFIVSIAVASAVELTFELPDNQKQCFYEAIEKGVQATVDFQVLDGGQYDVDAELTSPHSQVLFRGVKKQADTYTWTAEHSGVYSLCFSNEFSTFSHKLIYVDFEVGEEKPLPGIDHLPTTKIETSSAKIHDDLNTIIDYQTHHRLAETKGRKRAEDLNLRVMYWSLAETFVILFIGVGQIMILKSFFSDKK